MTTLSSSSALSTATAQRAEEAHSTPLNGHRHHFNNNGTPPPPQSLDLLEAAKQLAVPQAAAIATVLTKAMLHPIDTMKTRVQSHSHSSFGAFFSHYKGQWGPRHLYAGLPIKLLLYAPYQSLYMSTYMSSKPILYSLGLSAPPSQTMEDETEPLALGSQSLSRAVKQNKALEALFGAVVAEFACAGIRVPMEVIKVRLQASVTQNTQTAVGDMYRHGLRRVSRLFVPQTICHDLPYSITQWMVYEHVRPVLDKKASEWQKAVQSYDSSNHNGHSHAMGSHSTLSASAYSYTYTYAYTTRAHWWLVKAATFCVGASSGLVAGVVTVPLDNIKTRVILLSNRDEGRVASFFGTARDVVRKEGVRGMFRGGSWRVLWITTNTACFFPIFDCVKELLATKS